MRNLAFLLVITGMAWGLSNAAFAVPMYYTLTGEIRDGDATIFRDDAGAIANAGLAPGDTVSYTLLIDFDAAGYETHFGGYVDYDPYIDHGTWDYFYVDYISGDALSEVDSGFYNTVGPSDGSGLMDASEKNWGYNDSNGNGAGFLHVNSEDDMLQIKNVNVPIFEWAVGTYAIAGNWAFDSSNNQSQLFADLYVTSIVPVDDPSLVPEPSALFLLAAGLLGLTGVSLKRKK